MNIGVQYSGSGGQVRAELTTQTYGVECGEGTSKLDANGFSIVSPFADNYRTYGSYHAILKQCPSLAKLM